MNPDSSTTKDKGFSAIIQARMGATRLPGKVLLKLGDKLIIEHVIERIQRCHPKTIILAIPDTRDDYELRLWASNYGLDFVRGSEDNVLERFAQAVKFCPTDTITRVTGDNPFVDPEVTVRTVRELQRERADYAVMEGTPLGTTVEAFTKDAFQRILRFAYRAEEQEHVTLAVWNNPDKFKIHLIQAPSHLKCDDLRLTIDTEKDLEMARLLNKSLHGDKRMISLRDIIKYVNHNPIVKSINNDVEQRLSNFLKEKKSRVTQKIV